MKTKIRILCCVLCLVFALAACADAGVSPATPEAPPVADAAAPSPSNTPEDTDAAQAGLLGAPWPNGDLAGNLPGEPPELEDNFHMAVNFDWLSNATVLDGAAITSSFSDLEAQRKTEIMALIDGNTATGHETQLVQTLYTSMTDMESRNAQGTDPLLPYIEQIRNIDSLSGLTEFLCGSAGVIADPLCIPSVEVDDKDSSSYVVRIRPAALSLRDAGLYGGELSEEAQQKKDVNDAAYQKLFAKLGYTEEEAQAVNEAAFSIETLIAASCYGADAQARQDYREITYNARTMDELAEESPVFPLAQILETNGFGGSDTYVLSEPDWLKAMNEVYTEENLEGLKALLLYDVLGKTCKYLDQDFLDIYNEKVNAWYGISGEKSLEEMAYEECNQSLAMAVGKMYVDHYFTESVKEDVEGMIEQVRSVFKERLSAVDWLTDETKAKAIEKLDALTVRVGYPDVWTDYSSLELLAPEEGGSLMDNSLRIRAFEQKRAQQNIGQAVQKGEWSECYPQEVNAFYNEKDNSINIPAGILGGIFYDQEGTQEERLGGIGSIIGHEFTHAFDTLGSQYDKDGNLQNWWTDEDRAAFQERTDKVAAYYEQIEVLPDLHVDGALTIGETVADLGGMACMMDIAKAIDGFDYDAFFRAYAHVWQKSLSADICAYITMSDEHPLGYVRTNANVQQVQEFYDTYEIAAGDGMYLAPEDRLSVW